MQRQHSDKASNQQLVVLVSPYPVNCGRIWTTKGSKFNLKNRGKVHCWLLNGHFDHGGLQIKKRLLAKGKLHYIHVAYFNNKLCKLPQPLETPWNFLIKCLYPYPYYKKEKWPFNDCINLNQWILISIHTRRPFNNKMVPIHSQSPYKPVETGLNTNHAKVTFRCKYKFIQFWLKKYLTFHYNTEIAMRNTFK